MVDRLPVLDSVPVTARPEVVIRAISVNAPVVNWITFGLVACELP